METKFRSAMSKLAFVMTVARLGCTFVGLVTILMWLAGFLDLADFSLMFKVPATT